MIVEDGRNGRDGRDGRREASSSFQAGRTARPLCSAVPGLALPSFAQRCSVLLSFAQRCLALLLPVRPTFSFGLRAATAAASL